MCPEKSYMIPEKSKLEGQTGESMAISLKKRDTNTSNFESLEDVLHKNDHPFLKHKTPQKFCGACHYTCQTCQGPSAADCIICVENLTLQNSGKQAICSPENLVETKNLYSSTIDQIKTQLNKYSINQLILFSSLLGVILLISSVTIYLIFIRCECDLLVGIQNLLRGNVCNKVIDNDKRDKTFSKKYIYNPILELDEKTLSKDEELFMYHDQNEEYEIETDSEA